MKEGWKCPVCERGVSPDHATCDHKETPQGLAALYSPPSQTVYHYHQTPGPGWVWLGGNYSGLSGSIGGGQCQNFGQLSQC